MPASLVSGRRPAAVVEIDDGDGPMDRQVLGTSSGNSRRLTSIYGMRTKLSAHATASRTPEPGHPPVPIKASGSRPLDFHCGAVDAPEAGSPHCVEPSGNGAESLAEKATSHLKKPGNSRSLDSREGMSTKLPAHDATPDLRHFDAGRSRRVDHHQADSVIVDHVVDTADVEHASARCLSTIEIFESDAEKTTAGRTKVGNSRSVPSSYGGGGTASTPPTERRPAVHNINRQDAAVSTDHPVDPTPIYSGRLRSSGPGGRNGPAPRWLSIDRRRQAL